MWGADWGEGGGRGIYALLTVFEKSATLFYKGGGGGVQEPFIPCMKNNVFSRIWPPNTHGTHGTSSPESEILHRSHWAGFHSERAEAAASGSTDSRGYSERTNLVLKAGRVCL